jgi:hypothetical protein
LNSLSSASPSSAGGAEALVTTPVFDGS